MPQDIYVLIEHLQGKVTDTSFIMLAAARVLANGSGGNVVGLLLGYNAQNLADNLAADRVYYFDQPKLADFTSDAYIKTLSKVITDDTPRAVLFGHTSFGMDVASGLSASLKLPLVSQCRSVYAENGKLIFVSQICGGKIMADGYLPEPTAFITMVPGGFKPEQGQTTGTPQVISMNAPDLQGSRVSLNRYVVPDTSDVDISKEPLLIAVGRGIQTQDNISMAEELAEAMGGVVCASRPVVDQGWLPTSRLVGKSGKAVKPKIYFMIGISGAPEHTEAITGSEVIIAINIDPAAPIFNIAKYGANIDLFDLLPVLTAEVNQAK